MDLVTKLIPIDDISIPEISLRNVKKDSDDFQNLIQSIHDFGVMQTITVIRDVKNKGKFILEDGKHRLVGSLEARDLAKTSGNQEALNRVSLIPARIQDHLIEDVPFFQIQANLHRIETSPVEFARQIRRIWASPKFSAMSRQELFQALGLKKSVTWFDQQLGLANLCDEAEELINQGKISISAAYSLAKFLPEEQILWIERAQTEKVEDFTNAVNKRLAEIKEEKKGEKKERDPLDDIKPRKKTIFRDKIIELTQKIDSDPNNASLKNFAQGVLWGCCMDAETQAAAKAKEDAEKGKRDQILKLRREKLLAIQKEALPGINAEISKELGLPV